MAAIRVSNSFKGDEVTLLDTVFSGLAQGQVISSTVCASTAFARAYKKVVRMRKKLDEKRLRKLQMKPIEKIVLEEVEP